MEAWSLHCGAGLRGIESWLCLEKFGKMFSLSETWVFQLWKEGNNNIYLKELRLKKHIDTIKKSGWHTVPDRHQVVSFTYFSAPPQHMSYHWFSVHNGEGMNFRETTLAGGEDCVWEEYPAWVRRGDERVIRTDLSGNGWNTYKKYSVCSRGAGCLRQISQSEPRKHRSLNLLKIENKHFFLKQKKKRDFKICILCVT